MSVEGTDKLLELGLVEECENCGSLGCQQCWLGTSSKGSHMLENHSPCPSCDGRGFTLNQERLGRFLARWAVEGELPYSARVGDFIRDDQTRVERDAGKAALHRADKEAEQRNLALAEAAIAAFLFGDSSETRQEERQ